MSPCQEQACLFSSVHTFQNSEIQFATVFVNTLVTEIDIPFEKSILQAR